MAIRHHGGVLRQIQQLFQVGSVGGLTEWQLLDRYATRRDEAAFEALVAWHGPMVLGVCRRVLDDPQAVEDAFQATFLVLVRKAGSLGERDAIGHWLYGVARRVALHARSDAARRRTREVSMVRAEPVAPGIEPGGDELASILDEELGRLPSKYRAPVVLCYLEGLTHEEAARQLRWPVGSVKGRLARAKDLLRGRLARRGVLPSAGLVAAALGRNASASVPESLCHATVQAAVRISAGPAVAGLVSTSAVYLMEGVLSTMFLTKLKVTATVLGTCGCLALGAWALGQPSRGNKPGLTVPQAETTVLGEVIDSKVEGLDLVTREQALRDALEKPIDLKFSETRLGDVLKAIKKQTDAPGKPGLAIYVDPDGLLEAGVSIDSPVTIDLKVSPLKAALDRVLRPLKLAATTRDGLLVVSSRPEVALIELQALREQLKQLTQRPETSTTAVGSDGMSPAAWLKRMQGHRTTFSPNYDHEANPEDEAKTRAVLDALKKRVTMSFVDETPLEDVLAYIKQETKSQELPEGIPIYVDPVGLQEAEKTMTSPVILDIKGVALRESLRLILKQLGLVYTVKDGLLSITDEQSEDSTTPILELADKATLGELSVREMNDLIELFKAREQVRRYAAGLGLAGEGQAGGRVEPSTPATPVEPSTPTTPVATPKDAGPGVVIAAPWPAPPTVPVETPKDAGDDPKTKAILAALEKEVPLLKFQKTPIEDVVKEIQKVTAGPGLPEGIPIYLDPRSRLNGFEAEPRVVALDLKDVKLKTSLRLMLGQLGLAYTVKEGLLIIADPHSPEINPEMKAMGGMGGMGGGMR